MENILVSGDDVVCVSSYIDHIRIMELESGKFEPTLSLTATGSFGCGLCYRYELLWVAIHWRPCQGRWFG